MKFYNELFEAFKNYMEENSEYSPRIVKYNTNTSTYFPIVTFYLSNYFDTNECSLDKIEKYDQYLFRIDVYTKDKIVGNNTIASQVINDELTALTIKFFGDKLNMKLTSCIPTPNLDASILRKTIDYQCLIGNARGNIIRR